MAKTANTKSWNIQKTVITNENCKVHNYFIQTRKHIWLTENWVDNITSEILHTINSAVPVHSETLAAFSPTTYTFYQGQCWGKKKSFPGIVPSTYLRMLNKRLKWPTCFSGGQSWGSHEIQLHRAFSHLHVQRSKDLWRAGEWPLDVTGINWWHLLLPLDAKWPVRLIVVSSEGHFSSSASC